jgi:hypothetical protein
MDTFLGLGRSRGREMVEIEIVVGECQWVVGYLRCEWTVRDTIFCGFLAPYLG